jgi:ribosomal protein S18 acetylase RimI-like enzyme
MSAYCGLVLVALFVGGGDAFLTGGRHALGRHVLPPARYSCPAVPIARRHAWARCVLAGMGGKPSCTACTGSQVAVEQAREHMFGSLAQLRVGELSRNFPDISQREAELLEMTKVSSGTMCLVATVPADSPCAAGLPSPEIPGAANIREMRELGWMTEEAAAERLEELQREWERELAAGEHRVVVGAVDVQELNEAAFWEKPAWKSRQDDDASLFYICNMVVREQARRVGIGRKLLKAALEHARAADAQIVCLQVRHNNESAQQLYRTAGFCEADLETSEHILR